MNLPTILLAGIVALVAATPSARSLKLEVHCPPCTPEQQALALGTLRDGAPRFQFEIADSTARAPSLRLYIHSEDSNWTLSTTLSSPSGRPVRMSRQDHEGFYSELASEDVDSILAETSRTLDLFR